MDRSTIIDSCAALIRAYSQGKLGDYKPAEATAPCFKSDEDRLAYYTLPMALNYRRPSHQLWQAAKATYEDDQVKHVYDLVKCASNSNDIPKLRESLTAYKLALQPDRHTKNWSVISNTIASEWGVDTQSPGSR